jgi:hypothetical protein
LVDSVNRSPLAGGFLAGNRKAGENIHGAATAAAYGGKAQAPPSAESKAPESATTRAATDGFAHML